MNEILIPKALGRARISLTLLAVLLLKQVVLAEEPAWHSLFNGRDLAGWETYLAKPHDSVHFDGETRNAKGAHVTALGLGRDPKHVFSVAMVDGQPAIRISGEIFGALTTRESFADFHLRLEVRWGDKKWEPRLNLPRDGGLLYRAEGAWGSAGAWLPSLEFQIEEGDMGDFWAVNAEAFATARPTSEKEWIYDPAAPPKLFRQGADVRRCLKSANFEKPKGEWNVIELVCLSDQSWHLVNGHIVMHLTAGAIQDGAVARPAVSGRLQLQSEGAELFIRRIEWRPIDQPPSITR